MEKPIPSPTGEKTIDNWVPALKMIWVSIHKYTHSVKNPKDFIEDIELSNSEIIYKIKHKSGWIFSVKFNHDNIIFFTVTKAITHEIGYLWYLKDQVNTYLNFNKIF